MTNKRSLFAVLVITVFVFVLEMFGGFASNSLALLSDAGHVLTDAMALILALLAATFSSLPANQKRSYGYYRLEILSALFNGSILVLVALYIFYEAYLRLLSPSLVQSNLMLLVAAIGFFGNIGGAVILASASRENLNIRGAFAHVVSDAVSSLAVIIGGLVIHFWGWNYIDPILGFLIGILILRSAIGLVSESVNILLEGVPKDISPEEVVQAIKKIDGVEDIHDLHIWTITSGLNAISAHVIMKDSARERATTILKKINDLVKEKYKISHATFQTECEACPEEEEGYHH